MSEPNLNELQTRFQQFLLGRDDKVQGSIAESELAGAAARLDVYSNAYRIRLLEALANDFPGLKGLMGTPEFQNAAHAYITAHPSQHPSVRWFGQHLADFLRENEPFRSHPQWSETAAFEWAAGECFDAADKPILGIDAMAGIAPDRWAALTFEFQAGLRMLKLSCNAPAIWKAASEEQPLPDLIINETPVTWLLWRRDLKINWRSLTEDEAEAIEMIRDGDSFGALCEMLCTHVGNDAAPMRAASLLRQWLTDGIVSHIIDAD